MTTAICPDLAETIPMMSGLADGNSAEASPATDSETNGLLDVLADAMAVCTRACAAAHHYEELKSLSDQALRARGLERADLPRAAFEKLCKD
jgi:hypothetical protein